MILSNNYRRKERGLVCCAMAAGCLFGPAALRADVVLPSIFSEHMVLQKARGVPIWGRAAPNESVAVTLDGKTIRTAAGADGKWRVSFDLNGLWLAKMEYELPALTSEALAAVPIRPRPTPGMNASAIFNGVIHPIVPYSLAGILWYQGESNAGTAYEYRAEFPLMTNDWRNQWNRPELPFYFCQIANYMPKRPAPGPSEWAELREAQAMALRLPNTAMAVLIDMGESGDAHFRNKKAAADRLLRIALARNYGRGGVYAGPIYDSMSIEGNRIRVRFKNTNGGLVARPLPATYDVPSLMGQTARLIPNSPGSQLEGFAICGQDRKWAWADARIEKDTVVIQSDKVPDPIAVRYGWAENPTCNLYNAAGLPASPFRTDDFPPLTAGRHF